MVILAQSSNYQNCIKKTNKIPEYARDFKNEYLFIRGINKTCEKFVKKLDVDAKIFDTPQAYQLMLHFRRFLKAKELGYLDHNSEFKFEESDINFIESLELQLDDYMDLFYDIDSGKFNQERYDSYEYKNLVEFNDCFERFKSKVYVKEMTYSDFERNINLLDSDDEYDIFLPDSDSDDEYDIFLPDSDSDSD